MHRIKTASPKRYGSFTVTPKITGSRVYFNFNNRGGSACYDLQKGQFIPVRGEVGHRQKSWLEQEYIQK